MWRTDGDDAVDNDNNDGDDDFLRFFRRRRPDVRNNIFFVFQTYLFIDMFALWISFSSRVLSANIFAWISCSYYIIEDWA